MKRLIIGLTAGVLALYACVNKTGKTGYINEAAAFPQSLKSLPVNQRFITSIINKTDGTMSVLYAGKDNLWLVTWKKKSDENWFGANVPGSLLTVEILQDPYPKPAHMKFYNCYDRAGKLVRLDSIAEESRIGFIKSLKPSIFP